MPYIQIDTQQIYPPDIKKKLAEQIGKAYCSIMQARDCIVNVAFRPLGENGLLSAGNIQAREVGIISCDIRAGRPPGQREQFAETLVSLCETTLGEVEGGWIVYFTEHSGEEIYRDGRLSSDWEQAERS